MRTPYVSRYTDERRLDWIAKQADEFSSGILQDCPGDGDYFVRGMDGAGGQGRSFREAIDDAMDSVAPAQGAVASSGDRSPARQGARPSEQDLNPDLSASASPATKEQQ